MPAAAVIPAPVAYIKVVAVKKLVVEFLCSVLAVFGPICTAHPSEQHFSSFICRLCDQILYLEKNRVFQAGVRLNNKAWNNTIGLRSIGDRT